MIAPQIEYMGFKTVDATREYRLRVRQGDNAQEVTIIIENTAFAAKLVRYQDGPELCFYKLQRAMAAVDPMASRIELTDADFADYKASHTPKAPQRRKPQPPPVVS
jgi:hypothetical protein